MIPAESHLRKPNSFVLLFDGRTTIADPKADPSYMVFSFVYPEVAGAAEPALTGPWLANSYPCNPVRQISISLQYIHIS